MERADSKEYDEYYWDQVPMTRHDILLVDGANKPYALAAKDLTTDEIKIELADRFPMAVCDKGEEEVWMRAARFVLKQELKRRENGDN